MAVTKLMHMKQAKSGNLASHLKNAIDYILNPQKVYQGDKPWAYKGSLNCSEDAAYKEMINTKKYYQKEDGRQGYHFILSFKPGEGDADACLAITEKFVNAYLQDYEAVYAVHGDRNHIHSHVIFNSVSISDGKKYHYKMGDWAKMIQPLVDKYCMEEGLPPLEYHVDEIQTPEGTKEIRSYSGSYNWKERIKKDIDSMILASSDWEDFIQAMKDIGYKINYQNRKYVSLKCEGMQRYRRLTYKTMGEMYTPEAIIERIAARGRNIRMPIHAVRHTPVISSQKLPKNIFHTYKEMNFYEKVQIRHMLRIRKAIPQYQQSPGSWYASEQKKELQKTQERLRLTKAYGIQSATDIPSAIAGIREKMKEIQTGIRDLTIQEESKREIILAYKKGEDLSRYHTNPEEVQRFLNESNKEKEKAKADLKEAKRQMAVLYRLQGKKKQTEKERKQETRKERERNGRN